MVMEWGFKPEKNKDEGFEPVTGTYIARVDSLSRKKGTSEKTGREFDFYSITLQIAKTIKGDKAEKRLLFGAYNPDEEGVRKLANDMFTAGIDIDTSNEEAFDASIEGAKDKLITVKAWKAKKYEKQGDEWVIKDPVEFKQKWSIPSTQEDTSKVEEEEMASVPF